jgi:hypothetical protein
MSGAARRRLKDAVWQLDTLDSVAALMEMTCADR